MRHYPFRPVESRGFDFETLVNSLLSEFGEAALTMAQRLLSTAEGEARYTWQKIVTMLLAKIPQEPLPADA